MQIFEFIWVLPQNAHSDVSSDIIFSDQQAENSIRSLSNFAKIKTGETPTLQNGSVPITAEADILIAHLLDPRDFYPQGKATQWKQNEGEGRARSRC